MSRTEIILASSSPARLQVLRNAGVEPVVIPANVDEEAIIASCEINSSSPEDYRTVVLTLAQAKATAVAQQHSRPHSVIIGCDSMLFLDGKLLGKPHTAENAHARWKMMSGKTAFLLTGHAVISVDAHGQHSVASDVSSTAVTFGSPTESELSAYIDTGEPLKVAGAFTLDARGGWFIEQIHGDPSAVIGISLPLTRRLLQDLNVTVDMIWS